MLAVAALIAVFGLLGNVTGQTAKENAWNGQGYFLRTVDPSGKTSFRGSVFDSEGNIVAGARVTLVRGEKELATLSDTSGVFLFEGIEPGVYKALAIASGFKYFLIPEIIIASDEKVETNIFLEAGAVTNCSLIIVDPSKFGGDDLIKPQQILNLPLLRKP